MSGNYKIEKLYLPKIYGTVWESTKSYQIWYGSRFGAKSWTKAVFFLQKAMSAKYFRLVFARDTQKNVRTAGYQLFWDICNKFECFKDKFEFKDTTMEITCKGNGNFMRGGSFEQPDSLRSFADPTDFWADEPITREAEISRDSFLDIVGSLRNSYGMPTVFHFTFNPISKETWIYEDFFEKDLYDCERLFVNYYDNPFCPQSAIDFLESLKTIDPKRYLVDALGHWGVRREGLIFPDYELADEMPPVQFYGLDFGYTHPLALVAESVEDVPGAKQSLFVEELIYQSGLQSNTLIAEMNRLNVSKTLKIVCDNARPEQINDLVDAGFNATPCKKYSGSVMDGINRVKGFNIKILRGSRNLVDEIKNWVWDMKGGKLIDKPVEGMEHCFVAGTLISTISGKIPIEEVKVGELVLTRDGCKKVSVSRKTQSKAEVFTVQLSNGNTLTGTANHPIFIQEKGFIRLDAMTYGDKLFPEENLWKSLNSNQPLKPKDLNLIQQSTAATEMQNRGLAGIILAAEKVVKEYRLFCTEIFGNFITAKFPKDFIFTTKTTTGTITMFPTWNVFHRQSIPKDIGRNKKTEHQRKNINGTWQISDRLPTPHLKNLRKRAKGRIFIKIWAKRLGKTLSRLTKFAKLAKQLTNAKKKTAIAVSVRQNVTQNGDAMRALTMLKDSAKSANAVSFQINTTKPQPALRVAEASKHIKVVSIQRHDTKQDVYNLSVDETPEYFANGVLVHNCLKAMIYGSEVLTIPNTDSLGVF